MKRKLNQINYSAHSIKEIQTMAKDFISKKESFTIVDTKLALRFELLQALIAEMNAAGLTCQLRREDGWLASAPICAGLVGGIVTAIIERHYAAQNPDYKVIFVDSESCIRVDYQK